METNQIKIYSGFGEAKKICYHEKKGYDGTKKLLLYHEFSLITEPVNLGIISITKAWKNLGPCHQDRYHRFSANLEPEGTRSPL